MQDLHLLKSLDFTRKWYGRSMPREFSLRRLVRFTTNSAEFVRLIADAPMRVESKYPSACTDGKTVFMPLTYFMPEFYEALGIEDDDDVIAAAITCVNGSQIHEALHIRMSECDLEKFAGHNASAAVYFRTYKHFAAVLNIIEDYYIEARCAKLYPHLSGFLNSKNNVLFGDFVAEETWGKLSDPAAPAQELIGMLALLKNTRHRDDPHLAPWLTMIGVALTVTDGAERSIHDRAGLAVKVYDFLLNSKNEAGDKMDTTALEEGGKPDLTGMDGAALSALEQALGQALDQALANMIMGGKMMPAPGDQTELQQAMSSAIAAIMTPQTTDADESAANEEIDKVNLEFMPDRTDGQSVVSKLLPPILEDVDSLGGAGSALQEDADFRRLGTYLKYMRQSRTSLGLPVDAGQKIVNHHLWRIATDNNIMARRDHEKMKKGKPEVILLVDASGSMESGRGGRANESLVTAVSRAAMSTFGAFVRAGVPVSCFAHTTRSSSGRGSQSIVYSVAGHNMQLHGRQQVTNGNYVSRFNKILAIDHNSNIDGVALKYVGTRFSSKPGSKIILVLCDGEPAGGSDYHGKAAKQHTAGIARDLRRAGIHVLVASLTEQVVESNDEIYGKENNLLAHGNQLESSLKKLVASLSMPPSTK